MLTRICLMVALLSALPVWSQVEPSATGPSGTETEMQTPPPVSGQSYPTATGSEERSNFLRAGLNVQIAYDDNVIPGTTSKPVSDEIYSFGSSFALDEVTPRTHRMVCYSPGFTLYEPTSALNAMNQNATANYEYRLSPHGKVSLQNTFAQASNVFDQPAGAVSGSTQIPTAGVVAPFAEQRSYSSSGETTFQFSRNSMIGAGGNYSLVNYPNPAQAAGLSNSNSYGGSGFYNRRLSSTQYMGVNYQYTKMNSSASLGSSDTQVNTIYSFYTLYLAHSLSLSISGGPQHFGVSGGQLPASASWTPAINASMGWQRSRTNLAASYARTVNGAGGLLGAFQSTTGNASVRWQVARNWTVGSSAAYMIFKNVTPLATAPNQGGHSITGIATMQHPIGPHFTAEIGYSRLHQSYNTVPAVSADPDSDHAYVSISYQFARPLGR
jgi:hypothetical protein